MFTDGRELFGKLYDEDGKPVFLELSTKRPHYAFYDVTLPHLIKGYIFDKKGLVSKWYPNRDEFDAVVVDPLITFGRPVIDGTRINTSVLASSYAAEQSLEQVSEWFGIEVELVRQAVSFHEHYKAA